MERNQSKTRPTHLFLAKLTDQKDTMITLPHKRMMTCPSGFPFRATFSFDIEAFFLSIKTPGAYFSSDIKQPKKNQRKQGDPLKKKTDDLSFGFPVKQPPKKNGERVQKNRKKEPTRLLGDPQRRRRRGRPPRRRRGRRSLQGRLLDRPASGGGDQPRLGVVLGFWAFPLGFSFGCLGWLVVGWMVGWLVGWLVG